MSTNNRSSGQSSANGHSSGLSEEALETIRKFEADLKRSNRQSRRSNRLNDEIQQSLLYNSGENGVNTSA